MSRLLQVLREAIDCFPPELLPIVAEYCNGRHAWSTSTVVSEGLVVKIDGDRLTMTQSLATCNAWIRFVSKSSIVAASNRWTIRFRQSDPSWICAGITAASDNESRPSGSWLYAATYDDLVVLTTTTNASITTDEYPIRIFSDMICRFGTSDRKYVGPAVDASVSLEADYDNKRLRILFDDSAGNRQDLLLDVPPSIRLAADDAWRPCVIVGGNAVVDILPICS